MGMDDRAAELQLIYDLQKRLEAFSKLKESYLATIKELQDTVQALAKENEKLAYERDCLIFDIRDLQNRLDKLEK